MTSDSGLILVREVDERLDLSGLVEEHLVDSSLYQLSKSSFFSNDFCDKTFNCGDGLLYRITVVGRLPVRK